MFLKKFCAVIALLLLPGFALADHIPSPTGPVILTISGDVTRTNEEGVAKFDLKMLADMPATTFETSTIWTEGTQEFTGVELNYLVEELGLEGTNLVASAINDYHVEIPLSDAKDGGPILAYLRNGDEMSVRNKGPLWLVYPYDSNVEYRTETVYSRSIWQLDRIKVVK